MEDLLDFTDPWALPHIEFSLEDTTDFCERCKPHGKCLGLERLDDHAWRKSIYFHTEGVDKIIEEIPQEVVSASKQFCTEVK